MRHFFPILFLLFLAATANSRTIPAGKGQLIASLKKAIDLAKNGDTILLQPGLYKEGNLIITKSITIIGKNHPVLDGENKHEIFTLSGKNITIKGIHLANSAFSSIHDYAALKIIDASAITIENLKISNSLYAIHIANSTDIVIRNNDIKGTPTTEQNTGNGIHLWKCKNALIENNQIRGHRDGIYFEFVTESNINKNISENNIRYGLHFMFSNNNTYVGNTFRNNGAGVAVMYSHHVHMELNTFENNWGPAAYAILLKDISDSHIINNRFLRNTVGIYMEGANRIEVTRNIFKNNGWAMRVQSNCNDNDIHHNNFFSNTFDISTSGTLVLSRFYNNYWDKYEGYDLNKDGIGDVPYRPVSLFSMVIEQIPAALILLRSFMVTLLDKAEKAIPGLTPENLIDEKPMMKPIRL